jgi:hypothetical protein
MYVKYNAARVSQPGDPAVNVDRGSRSLNPWLAPPGGAIRT